MCIAEKVNNFQWCWAVVSIPLMPAGGLEHVCKFCRETNSIDDEMI